MKKLFATLLTLSMVMCFFGCADKTDKPDAQKPTQNQVTAENNEVTGDTSENNMKYGIPVGDELGGAELAGDRDECLDSEIILGGDLTIGGGLSIDDEDFSSEIGLEEQCGQIEEIEDIFIPANP